MLTAWQPSFPMIHDCVLVVSPEHYATLLRGGVTSKAELKRRLFDKCNAELAPSLRKIVPMAKPELGFLGTVIGAALGVVSQAKVAVGLSALTQVPKFRSLDSFHIIVAGGDAGKFSAFMPCFGLGLPGSSTALSRPVHRGVEPIPPGVATRPAPFSTPLVLLSPMAEGDVTDVPRAPRTKTLTGTVGLLDISKPGGSVLLDTIGLMLQTKFPGLTLERFTKPTFSRPAATELVRAIASRCSVAVVALAD